METYIDRYYYTWYTWYTVPLLQELYRFPFSHSVILLTLEVLENVSHTNSKKAYMYTKTNQNVESQAIVIVDARDTYIEHRLQACETDKIHQLSLIRI